MSDEYADGEFPEGEFSRDEYLPEPVEPDDTRGDLQPREIDRMFDLLETAVEEETLTPSQTEQLVSVLEQAVSAPTAADPEALSELLTMLEEVIIDPEDISEVDIDGILGLFEEALAGVTVADPNDLADVFDVIEEGLRDPTSVDPEDVERFQSGLQRSLLEWTDPANGLGQLLSFPFLTDESDDEQPPLDAFRIAQLAATMTQRASGYSVESGVRTGTRLAYATANAESPAKLLTSARAITLDELERAGIDIGEQQAAWLDAHEDEAVEPRPVTRERLERRGEELLTRSAQVGRDESVHPSYGPMLDQLATDEARILRLLATEGPQGAIDIYEKQYLPPNRWLVAENLTMVGREAGCRDKQRVPVYLENLQRLHLIEVSEEPIENLKRYEVLEAQGHVEHARNRARRPRANYKSVRLTDLGVEFCELCFPFTVRADARGVRLRRNADGSDEE